MKGTLWINELGTHKEDRKVFCQKKRIYWDMFFNERTRFLFQNYDVVKESTHSNYCDMMFEIKDRKIVIVSIAILSSQIMTLIQASIWVSIDYC